MLENLGELAVRTHLTSTKLLHFVGPIKERSRFRQAESPPKKLTPFRIALNNNMLYPLVMRSILRNHARRLPEAKVKYALGAHFVENAIHHVKIRIANRPTTRRKRLVLKPGRITDRIMENLRPNGLCRMARGVYDMFFNCRNTGFQLRNLIFFAQDSNPRINVHVPSAEFLSDQILSSNPRKWTLSSWSGASSFPRDMPSVSFTKAFTSLGKHFPP